MNLGNVRPYVQKNTTLGTSGLRGSNGTIRSSRFGSDPPFLLAGATIPSLAELFFFVFE